MPGTASSSENSSYAPESGVFDEAVDACGVVRPHARPSIEVVREDPRGLMEDVTARGTNRGVVFNSFEGDKELVIDPVPRVIEHSEWSALEAALAQRVRALDMFVDDIYGIGRAISEGVVPERVIQGAEHYDPGARELRPPRGVWIGVAGLDLVRDAAGTLLVLEDNVRTPSGYGYALAARELVTPPFAHLPPRDRPVPIDHGLELLADTLADAAPGGAGDDPLVVLLSDGPGNSAWWEHELLSERLGIALATADQLETRGDRLWLKNLRGRPVDVVYRRTDACDSGSWVADLIGPALRAGTVGVVNGLGTGVADDKLVHRYVEDLVRFYLDEEPLIGSVRTFDPSLPGDLEEVLDRAEELVIKPRGGSGGAGVVVCPHASAEDVQKALRAIREDPTAYIAQELVMLSTHPTVIDGELQPRHVDLRPFIYLRRDRDARVVPGGLTRVALDEGALVVNSSQNGGAKDTWVMPG